MPYVVVRSINYSSKKVENQNELRICMFGKGDAETELILRYYVSRSITFISVHSWSVCLRLICCFSLQ